MRLGNILMKFRQTFEYQGPKITQYFPMHMAKGFAKIQNLLKSVDCIIEVHDARIPFSGRNITFQETLSSIRPKVLLFNKTDLIGLQQSFALETALKHEDPTIKSIFYSSCKSNNDKTIKQELLPEIIKLIRSNNRYNRSELAEYQVMVIGIPNVGKSTVINRLRNFYMNKGKATPTGAKPGVTKTVMEKIKISDHPKVYILDTPGILPPSIPHIEVALKLALCATIPEKPFGLVTMADFLLFILNKLKIFKYVNFYEMFESVDEIYEFLLIICKKFNFTHKVKSHSGELEVRPNLERAAQVFIKDFREGKLGKVNLDQDIIKNSLYNQKISWTT